MPATAAVPRRSFADMLFGVPGRVVMRRLQLATEVGRLLALTLKSVWLERGKGRVLVSSAISKQIRFTGVDALPLISLLALLMGLAVGLVIVAIANQAVTRQFAPLAQRIFIEISTATASPMLITLIVIARSGTAISTELGTMRIRNELQVFDALGINIYYLLIWPRVVGMVVSLVCLTIYFNFLLIGAQFAAVNSLAQIDAVKAGEQIIEAAHPVTLVQAVLKTGVIGVGISIIACHFGLSARRSFTEIPQVATKGVVNSIIFSVLANVVIFVCFLSIFGLQFLKKG